MIRIVSRTCLQRQPCRSGRGLAGVLLAVLLAGGCAPQGLAPDAIPDVPPVEYHPATEVPAGTISTVPESDVPQPVSGHEPVLPSTSPAPMTAVTLTSPAAVRPVPATTPRTAQEQRIAALELTLLDMSNELAWLKSQPASPTTPWGTPSPKVVPEAPASPPLPASEPVQSRRKLSKAEQEQAERINNLEQNIKTLQAELELARSQTPQATPWGTTTPDAARIAAEAEAAPPLPLTSLAERKPTVTVGVLPTEPTPPPAPTPPAPVVTTPAPEPPVNPEAMTQYPVTVPLASVAGVTIPPPSPSAIATPPLESRSARSRAATSPQPAPVQPVQPSQPVQSVRPAAVTPAPATTPAPVTTQAAPRAQRGEQAAYQAAYNAYEGRRYNEAWNAFDRYLAEYPNGRYAPNALYWKGEVRYSLGDYAGAILLFKDVIARFPGHAKAPDALLKVAMSYDKLHDRDNASLHVRILNEDYPSSEAARRAKRMGLT